MHIPLRPIPENGSRAIDNQITFYLCINALQKYTMLERPQAAKHGRRWHCSIRRCRASAQASKLRYGGQLPALFGSKHAFRR